MVMLDATHAQTGKSSGESEVLRLNRDSSEDDVMRACARFVQAHSRCLARFGERSQVCGEPDCHSGADYRRLSSERAMALQAVRRHRAISPAALTAKRDVLHRIVDWLGYEEPAVGEFASELVDEYHAALMQSHEADEMTPLTRSANSRGGWRGLSRLFGGSGDIGAAG